MFHGPFYLSIFLGVFFFLHTDTHTHVFHSHNGTHWYNTNHILTHIMVYTDITSYILTHIIVYTDITQVIY